MNTLTKNGYPEQLVKSTMKQTALKISKPKPNVNMTENKKYVSIPYITGLFEKIKTFFKQYDIEVVGKGDNTLKQNAFTSIKDKVPKLLESNLIYMVICECGKIYVGQTKRKLQKILADHQYYSRIGKKTHSALCEHIIETGHIVKWEKVKILHKVLNKHSRDIMEMIEIKTRSNTINKQQECKFLSNTYNNII